MTVHAVDHVRSHGMDVLTFHVDRRPHAIAVTDVEEILRAVAVAPLPRSPRVVLGVINLRGRIVPVLDMRIRFGAPRRALRSDEHFVVVRAAGRIVALRTDRAVGLSRVSDEQIQPATAVTPNSSFVAGLASLPDGVLLIADAPSFLTEAESTRLDEALAARDGDA
jgi:purine-binding chemotaxis protein CheW